MSARCDVGGDHRYPDLNGPAVLRPSCESTPTHRYRSPGMADGHWQYRCTKHVGRLDTTVCIIEPLTGAAS